MSHQLEKAVVWSVIPVTDMQKAMAFYNAVFGYELTLDTSGPNPMAIFPAKEAKGSCGHLYPGKPARDGEGPTLHLGVPGRLEDAMARLRSAGGTLLPVPPISIPSGRFVYAKDPDGNSIGLFEPAVS